MDLEGGAGGEEVAGVGGVDGGYESAARGVQPLVEVHLGGPPPVALARGAEERPLARAGGGRGPAGEVGGGRRGEVEEGRWGGGAGGGRGGAPAGIVVVLVVGVCAALLVQLELAEDLGRAKAAGEQ